MNRDLVLYKKDLERELKNNILPFWIRYARDEENGGFYGYISDDLHIDVRHEKSSVLNSRILWTFSTAYRIYGSDVYRSMADRAFEYIKQHFIDSRFSGVYWMLDQNGRPTDTKKQIYAIAFAIYGLSEYYRASNNPEALSLAIEQFECLEQYARDPQYGGYFEAFAEDWSPLGNVSLSPKDMNASKSMNTNLHVLEAYTNLLRVWKSDVLKNSLEELLAVMLKNIINHETGSLKLFFDEDWTSRAEINSYGHDIEASWLIREAAEILGNPVLLEQAVTAALNLAGSVLREGLDSTYGGIYYEKCGSVLHDNKDWWPQAEAVTGFFNAYELTGEQAYLDYSQKTWTFIQQFLVDKTHGEWFWGVTRNGGCITSREKAGPWKCPYHNSRMCFELIRRITEFLEEPEKAAT